MSETLNLGAGNWGVKDGSLLGYNSENNNYKPLPFNFTRATSATRVNKDGLIEVVTNNKPRIDFKDDANGALLLEPERRNLITYSNKFDIYWSLLGLGTGSAPILNNDSVISPDGNQNATEVILNVGSGTTTSDRSSIEVNQTVSAGSEYTVSFYIKGKNDGDQLMIGAINGGYELITLTTEWKRYTITQTAASSPRAVFIGIRQGVFGTLNNNVEFYLYGAQLEQGSYATSYIPTQGSQVTVAADSCIQTPPSGIIGQTEGTMFFEIDFANTSGVYGAWSISNGSSANRITMNTTNLSSTEFTLSIAQNYNSGSTKLISANVTFSERHKVAIKYSGTTLKLFVDGQLVDSVSTDGFGNYTNFYVGGNQVGLGGDVRKFIQANLFNTALTDQELQQLTSL